MKVEETGPSIVHEVDEEWEVVDKCTRTEGVRSGGGPGRARPVCLHSSQ